MANEKFRVIVADVAPIVASLPVKLPNPVKILARSGDWQPLGDGSLTTRDDAEHQMRTFGILATTKDKNKLAVDIEELFT